GLIDHELYHARLAYTGFDEPYLAPAVFDGLPPRVARRLFEAVSELQAYRHELAAARRYRLPPRYHQVAAGAYLTYYLRLLEPDPAVPAALRDALLVALFEDWMLRQERVLTRDAQGWRFEVEERRYELPPAVVAALAGRARDGGVAAGAGP
ncbi:MAG TPA: hypothetical protein VGQ83_08205, partial [Polyangia bacterium]